MRRSWGVKEAKKENREWPSLGRFLKRPKLRTDKLAGKPRSACSCGWCGCAPSVEDVKCGAWCGACAQLRVNSLRITCRSRSEDAQSLEKERLCPVDRQEQIILNQLRPSGLGCVGLRPCTSPPLRLNPTKNGFTEADTLT